MGALDTVLDSNARVTPFRILLQVPSSQISWVIASGEHNHRVSSSISFSVSSTDSLDQPQLLNSLLGFVLLRDRSCHRGGEQALGLAGPQPASLTVCV